MLEFNDSARSEAPPEEVWKILYDPVRFTDWWDGMETGRGYYRSEASKSCRVGGS